MKRGPAILITFIVSALFAVFFIYPAGMVVKQAFEGPQRVHAGVLRRGFPQPDLSGRPVELLRAGRRLHPGGAGHRLSAGAGRPPL